jgi:hypothetical protein
MMQDWITGLIVVSAFWTVAMRYAPKAVKRAIRSRLARTAQRVGWRGLALKLQAEAANAAKGCSDGCSSCGACSPPGQAVPPQRAIPIKVQKEPASHC